jgi:hypothetical protein
MFGEARIQLSNQRDVESIQPDHGPGGFVTVIVPPPARGQDQIVPVHVRSLAIERSEATLTVHDES